MNSLIQCNLQKKNWIGNTYVSVYIFEKHKDENDLHLSSLREKLDKSDSDHSLSYPKLNCSDGDNDQISLHS